MSNEHQAGTGGVFVVFLRGINVGGHRSVKMAALRDALKADGFEDVQTYIQSGNIVVRAPGDPATVATRVQALIERDFGFAPQTMALSATDLASAAERCPYPAEAEANPKQVHAFFLESAPPPEAITALEAYDAGVDRWHLDGLVLYLHTPNGLGTSKLAVRGRAGAEGPHDRPPPAVGDEDGDHGGGDIAPVTRSDGGTLPSRAMTRYRSLVVRRLPKLHIVLLASALAATGMCSCGDANTGDPGGTVTTADGLAFPTHADVAGGDAVAADVVGPADAFSDDLSSGATAADSTTPGDATATPDAPSAPTGEPAVWWRPTVGAATWADGSHRLALRVGVAAASRTFEDSKHRLLLRPGAAWRAPQAGDDP